MKHYLTITAVKADEQTLYHVGTYADKDCRHDLTALNIYATKKKAQDSVDWLVITQGYNQTSKSVSVPNSDIPEDIFCNDQQKEVA